MSEGAGPSERVQCQTTKGPLSIEVRPDWAPNGARRFLELVDVGFFTHMPFHRVPALESNPIAQFGISPFSSVREAVKKWWPIQDDLPQRRDGKLVRPWVKFAGQERIPQMKGCIGFAGSGPNSRSVDMWMARSTFVDIHVKLGTSVWDVPVAQIVNAAALQPGGVVDKISVVGDMAPWGKGPDAGKMLNDPSFSSSFPGTYLRGNFPTVDYFLSCETVVEFPQDGVLP